MIKIFVTLSFLGKLYIIFCFIIILLIIFCVTSLLVSLLKKISVAFWPTKKLNVKKIFIILYSTLLLSLTLYELFHKTVPYVDLGNSFQYLNEGEDLDYSGYVGDGIFFYRNFKGVPVIFPKVEKYAFDSIYITVKQEYHKKNSTELMMLILLHHIYDMKWGGVNTEIFSICDSIMYHDFRKFYEKGQSTYRVEHYADSIVSNNQYFKEMRQNDYNYYIIEKHNVVKHGPLSRKEFEKKFISFGLTQNLWIDE